MSECFIVLLGSVQVVLKLKLSAECFCLRMKFEAGVTSVKFYLSSRTRSAGDELSLVSMVLAMYFGRLDIVAIQM